MIRPERKKKYMSGARASPSEKLAGACTVFAARWQRQVRMVRIVRTSVLLNNGE